MDELEKKLTLTLTHEGKTFTFRRPTVKQLIAADVLSAQMRSGMPVNAMSYGYVYSNYAAALNTYVTEPKDFDFTDFYDEDLVEIHEGVANWLNTFRKPIPKPE